MSRPQKCSGCEMGRHDEHVQDWNIRPGVIGGSYCPCPGGCEPPDLSKSHVFAAASGVAGGEPTRPSEQEWSARVIDAVFNDPENLDVILCDHDHEVQARVVAAVEAEPECLEQSPLDTYGEGYNDGLAAALSAARGATGGKT